MGREVKLPNSPTCHPHLQAALDAQHKKLQTLKYVNGYAVPADLEPPALEGCGWTIPPAVAPTAGASTSPLAAAAAPASAALPKWVTHDKQVLRYSAYFIESVPDSPAEDWRARRVQLLYYLADDSLQVDEPREPNSGILQVILMRHTYNARGTAMLL